EYNIVLQRKDPPVDSLFIAIAKFFAQAPKNILQINNPSETYLYSEHLLPAQFPDFSVKTRYFESFEELGRFLSKQKVEDEFVLKPLNSCSGMGVSFFGANSSMAELVEYWQKWGPGVVVQDYEKAIEEKGDLR